MTRHFVLPISLALVFATIGCDGRKADWLDSDSAQEVEERAVPPLVDKVAPKSAEATKEIAAKTVDVKPSTRTSDEHVATTTSGADEAEPTVDVDADLFVKRLVVSSGVQGREPVGANTTFTAGASERIYAFVEVGNRDASASAITVSFVRDGKPVRGGVELRVGSSPRWRTWAYTRLAKEPGSYQVVVSGPRGQELARQTFTVVAAEATPQAAAKSPKAEPQAAAKSPKAEPQAVAPPEAEKKHAG
jgi:Protein of unknown function (DUF2914)